ncbi:histidinol-phosphatase [Halobacteriales archaeon QS_8_69_26]|nr:MAG: histidinol-phosphatase [Halobacteriales archaeon QS_8_69_26]
MQLAVDLHTHTRFFHGAPRLGRAFDPLGVRMLAWVARRRDLDAVATTNHDYYRELSVGKTPPGIVPGIEVTSTRGHVLVVGPSPPRRTEPGELTPAQVVDVAHDRGCAAVIPHPFRNSTVREADADFDAIEINGKGTESYDEVRELARDRGLPLVGGSDAHYPVEVGRAYTVVDADDPTPEGVVDAIRDGRVEARVDVGPSQRVVRAAYKLIHARKGWLDRQDPDPEPQPPGIGMPPGEQEAKGGSLPSGAGDPGGSSASDR